MTSLSVIKEDTKMTNTILESSTIPVLITEVVREDKQRIDFITSQSCVQDPMQSVFHLIA